MIYLDEVKDEVQHILPQSANVWVHTFSPFLNHLAGPLGDNLSMGDLATSVWIYTCEPSFEKKKGNKS